MNHDDFISYGPGSLWQFKSQFNTNNHFWPLYKTPVYGNHDTEAWHIPCDTPILFLGKANRGVANSDRCYKVMVELNGEIKIGWITNGNVERLTRLSHE